MSSKGERETTKPFSQDDPRYKKAAAFHWSSASPNTLCVSMWPRAATCCLVSTISPVRLGVCPSPPTVIIMPLMISVATCIEKCSSIVQPPSPHQHTLYMPIPQLGLQGNMKASLCYNEIHRTPWTAAIHRAHSIQFCIDACELRLETLHG